MTRRYSTVTEHPYLDKLIEATSRAEAAEALGLSSNAFAPSNLAEGIRPAFELAAKQVYLERFGADAPERTYILRLPAESAESTETVIRALGGKLLNVQF